MAKGLRNEIVDFLVRLQLADRLTKWTLRPKRISRMNSKLEKINEKLAKRLKF